MPRALILGGTGLIGRATATRLLGAGWRVDVTGRERSHVPAELADARFLAVDRADDAALAGALGDGADLLVDCICFTAADATRLLPLLPSVGSTVLISSKAVYVDADGRHSNTRPGPRFDAPVRETQPTMAPRTDIHYDSPEGYGANKVAAEQVLLDSGSPVTVLRPSKVHGAGAAYPREWFFVKRALDRRPVVLLAHRGEGTDHPSAARNMAALIELVAAKPGRRILNSVDPDAPSALEISRIIANQLEHVREEVLLEGEVDGLGRHPWPARPPIILDMSAAVELGYRPVGDYAATVTDEVAWLVAQARFVDGAAELPSGIDAEQFGAAFEYAAEDAYLARDR